MDSHCPVAGGPHGPRRRSVLAGGLASAGAAALAGCTAASSPGLSTGTPSPASAAMLPPRSFYGVRQAGIVEDPPQSAAWIAMDLPAGADKDHVRRLMRILSGDIARMMAGKGGLTDQEPELAAVAGGLTVTVAWGPRVFAAAGARAPVWLKPLPAFSIDKLQPRYGGGDLILQVCADSPVTVAHTQRRLIASVGSLARLRWVQRGFREPLSRKGGPLRMRNLFGQVDGTIQPSVEGDDDALLWVSDDAEGMKDGSAMVIRRIAMDMEAWDRVDRLSRENAIGRRLDNGAPLTGGEERSAPDLERMDSLGFPIIDDASHMRRAMPQAPHERILRRPYNYDDEPAAGQRSNSGLVFVAFCADPVRQFVPIQQRLAKSDLLNIWTTPIGSTVAAVLPGVPKKGGYLGQHWLEA
ncbi:MAG: Dyp-type peroxidase [Micrococcales bacterium]|nr:Dyp-type peroxidase [Micrococcales bacterium]